MHIIEESPVFISCDNDKPRDPQQQAHCFSSPCYRHSADGRAFRYEPYATRVLETAKVSPLRGFAIRHDPYAKPGVEAWDNTGSESFAPSSPDNSLPLLSTSLPPLLSSALPESFNTETPKTAEPHQTHTAALAKHCEFFEIPSICPDVIQRTAEARRPNAVFVGQVRFDVSPTLLAFTFKALLGVAPSRVNVRGPGCFSVNFANAEDAASAKALTGRVMWESLGIWRASDDAGEQILKHYMEATSTERSQAGLPRDMMVIRK